jgi:O-methyltransferase
MDDDKSRQRYEVIRGGRSPGIGGDEYYGYRDNLYEEVQASFARRGLTVDGNKIQLHKGLFQDTWPNVTLDCVAFAHIDCDWYDSVRYCLESIGDKISPGGIILLDDYNDYGGARKAVDGFIAMRSDFLFEAGPNPILRKAVAGHPQQPRGIWYFVIHWACRDLEAGQWISGLFSGFRSTLND